MKKSTPVLVALFLILAGCTKDDGSFSFSGYNSSNPSGEQYNDYQDNPFVDVTLEPISTFSIDADGGSYSNVRRFLHDNQLPPVSAVRIEELINYFPFDYPSGTGEHPLTLNGEVADCPWTEGHKLIRIGMRGNDLPNPRPASNIVFLIDVSGSMSANNKLPLLKHAYKRLVDQLNIHDKVAIVTYAGNAGVAMGTTTGDQKTNIKKALDKLDSGGSTAGGAGITKAYEIAKANFVEGGNNRIILGTDGDFNVGVSNQDDLIKLIESKRDEGIFITVCGVGTGNYHDGAMEQIADHGNGTYEYIDSKEQGEKVFVEEFTKFFTVAKDVKIQVEFNPDVVKRYRLIGYENRVLSNEDFEDDTKDAGELGASQTVTALYELEMQEDWVPKGGNVFEINFRYKKPTEDVSKELNLVVRDFGVSFEKSSENMRFAAGVAAYGMLLRKSQYAGNADFDKAKNWVQGASTFDPNSYRAGLPALMDKAKSLQ